MTANLPALRPDCPPQTRELLDKLQWHLTWINNIVTDLSARGVKASIATSFTKTGKALLVIAS